MRWIAVCALIAATVTPSLEQEPREYVPLPDYRVFGSPATPGDEQAITELMAGFSRAWSAQDVDALLATYTDDAEWINAFGATARGHEELRDVFTWLFERFGPPIDGDDPSADSPDNDRSRGKLSRRYIGENAAVIHGVTESDWGENRDGSGLRRVHITYVLEKRNGKWRIAHQMIMDARR